jgi:hypothetical protein
MKCRHLGWFKSCEFSRRYIAFLLLIMVSFAAVIAVGAVLTRIMVAAQACWQDMACTGPQQAAFSGDWDKYISSPPTRSSAPVGILNADNTFRSAYEEGTTLSGNGSMVIFDFGQEVGGLVTLSYNATGSGTLGLAFSEAKNWTGTNSDSSNGNFHTDGALFAAIVATEQANYTMPIDRLRGGFRYLTLFVSDVSEDPFSVVLQDITVDIAYQPSWPNLRAYQGYFYSNDDLLNKIWYAGAFTLQTNAIPDMTGRELLGSGWENTVELNLGTTYPTIYVDGSKRDRTVWAGDLGVAIPSLLVSTGDIYGAKNTIQVLLNSQVSARVVFPGAAAKASSAKYGGAPLRWPGA